MKVTLSSMFRNSVPYLHRYFAQVKALRREVDVRLVIAEGDSQDSTYGMLHPQLSSADTLIKVDHGGIIYGSVNRPQRWANIATVARAVVGAVSDPGDVFLWVEADLIWDASTMLRLLDDTMTKPAVAPMVYCSAPKTNRFYDVWGYRREGQKFRSYAPHWNNPTDARYVKLDSCGSCFAVSPEAWGSVVGWDGMWPFTADGELWLDAELVVRHP